MPVETTGFSLKPFGFFTQNPGLDVPPGKNEASRLHAAAANGSSVGGAAPATPRAAAAAVNGSNGCCGSQE